MIRSPLLLLLANALSNDSSVIEKSFNFGVGIPLSALLLILALRSSGEHSATRLGFALCALTFTLSACIKDLPWPIGSVADRDCNRRLGILCGCGLAGDDSWTLGARPLSICLETAGGPSGFRGSRL